MSDRSEYFKKYREENKEKRNEYSRKYYHEKEKKDRSEYFKQYRLDNIEKKRQYDREHKREYKKRHRAQRYGITVEEYNKMLEEQNGVCKICGSNEKLCIDHDHKTGEVRAILCSKCNSAIGLMNEDTNLFEKAIAYLKKKL